MRIYLGKMGIEDVEEAHNVKAGLKKLRHEKFDLVLSDRMMPGMSGLDLLEEVRKDEMLKDTSFIMVTAESLKGCISEAYGRGASGYVIKPYTFETFSEEIEKVLLNQQ